MEIDVPAAATLQERLTRRLIALELADTPGTESHALFVRVLGAADGSVRVELWERGVWYGARRVTTKPGASQNLRARRIALAVGVLARGMGRKLRAEADRQQAERAQRERRAAEAQARHALRPGLAAGLAGAVVGPGDLWLLGPALAAELRLGAGASLSLGATWLTGAAPALSGSPAARVLELNLHPAYALPVGRRLDLEVGALAAAGSVHFAEVRRVDAIPGQHDTWSARATASVRLGWWATRTVLVQAGPEAGVLLRRLLVTDRAGIDHRLGGAWLGLGLGVALDPGRPTALRR